MPAIERPHPDIELGVPREKIEYSVRLPSQGLSPETGLILYIPGCGFRHNDAYAEKLLPHLADTYDCLALSVGYQGYGLYSGLTERRPAPDFFAMLEKHHGVSVTATTSMNVSAIAVAVCREMAKRGVTSLHPHCQTVSTGVDGYANFGVLPTLDHLQVLGVVLRDYPVNRKRLFALGTSYGGYLALLLGKFAPNTFRLIVDNSGFSGPGDTLETLLGITIGVGTVQIVNRSLLAFSADPQSPNFLTPARMEIRDIAVAGHYGFPSTTVLHSYHSEVDTVAPTKAKKRLAEVLKRHRDYDLRLVGEDDIDGRLFKTTAHGMNASLRGLFEVSYRRWSERNGTWPETTDFDLGTVVRLPCGKEDYVLAFARDDVRLTIG